MSDEWAKTTGKGIDAARELGRFLAPIVKTPLENAMGIVADKLVYMRWERQQRLMILARKFMLEQGMSQPTRAVALNVAIPLMQAASMEEDDVLQDTWARLLVNAMDQGSGVEMRRSFVTVLEEMTPLEIKILDMLHTAVANKQDKAFVTERLPEELICHKDIVEGDKRVRVYDEQAQIALWNLVRLGCVNDVAAFGAERELTLINLTPFGEAFVQACTLKPKPKS